jgi:predicted short-subunit dehydrogenase-like oxidoreductase (DUF2520 family)
MTDSVALIGPGRVGSAIAKFLVAANYRMTAVIGRHPERTAEACAFIGCPADCATTELRRCADARIILLAVPDDRIATVASKMAKTCALDEKFLIHFSGLLPSSILQYDTAKTERLLSLHPLFPFANCQQAYENLKGCPCALEGGSEALRLGQHLVTTFSGQPFEITAENKPLYHTAASMASNFLVTLLGISRDLLRQCGIPENRLTPTLMPLIHATLANINALPPEQGLTGPIVRGDSGTVKQHLKALDTGIPEILATYRQLARATLALACRSGRLDPVKAAALAELLKTEDPG